jgi:predicted GNAT superfamily acetyltransferase
VRVVEVEAAGAVREVADLFREIWRTSAAGAPMAAELLRAFAHSGNYVAGAYDGDRLVGASAGFLSGSGARLHSHITGVAADYQGQHVGVALKLHQRAWALDRGIEEVEWTFDPLVRRNAWFNLSVLGAFGRAYLRDFYGDMADGINAGQGSDRLLVVWPLRHPRVIAAAEGEHQPASLSPTARLVTIPADIERLRADDPVGARQWRATLRGALEPAFGAGLVAVGMTRDGAYVLDRPEEAS